MLYSVIVLLFIFWLLFTNKGVEYIVLVERGQSLEVRVIFHSLIFFLHLLDALQDIYLRNALNIRLLSFQSLAVLLHRLELRRFCNIHKLLLQNLDDWSLFTLTFKRTVLDLFELDLESWFFFFWLLVVLLRFRYDSFDLRVDTEVVMEVCLWLLVHFQQFYDPLIDYVMACG